MKYTCWGAAKQVTGSMHLLKLENGYTILIDCGIDYEDKSNKEINSNFPFWFILKENILTFIFIVIVEAMFFYYIAMKYYPILQSDVNTIVKTRLQKNLT